MSRSKQVIVSGATGFVGQHLLPLLLREGHEVVAVIRNVEKARTFDWFKDVRVVQADLLKNDIDFTPQDGASLVHLAWHGLPNYDALFHFEENLPGSYRFVKELVGRGVSKVLVTGTCFEYGLTYGPIAADAPAKPVTPYAMAKDTLRQCLTYLAAQRPFTLQWARLFYMHGPGQNPKSLLAQLDAAIDAGAEVFNMSGGEQLRDYLPIETVAERLRVILAGNEGGTFHVSSGEPISIRRLVENRIKERDSNIRLNLGFFPYTKYEPMAFWGARDA